MPFTFPLDEKIIVFFGILLRVTSFISFFPFFGERSVPMRIKILTSFVLGIFLYPLVEKNVAPYLSVDFGILIWAWIAFFEVILGAALGLLVRMLFFAVLTAAQFVSTQMGFNMSNIYDPMSGSFGVHMNTLFYLFAMMVFLALNAHHLFIEGLARSFELIALGGARFNGEWQHLLTDSVTLLFIVVAKLSAPIIVVTFMANAAMGVISRVIPQMNVMMVAFSVNILIGFFVLFASLPMLFTQLEVITADFFKLFFQALNVL
jgi:flagellar biosynthetic protein FliR